jgi:hypothetical protein
MPDRVSTTAGSERGRYAALMRSRASDDPDLIEARRLMREEALVNAIARALRNPPPITAELRARIDALLAHPRVVTR